jgi:hypothetical protein
MSTTPNTLQWLRRYQLIIGSGGNGLSIDNLNGQDSLRITFEITKTMKKSPNSATIKIYNLNDNNLNQIQNEFTDVILSAGYKNDYGLIFTGSARFINSYWEDGDIITEINCGDGDKAYVGTFVNVTFAAGSTDTQIVNHIVALMNDVEPIQTGTLQLGNAGCLRGRTFSGPAHRVLDVIARTNGCHWSIQDGTLHMIRADAMLPTTNQAFVLSQNTGMMGLGERTDKGIKATCLLNWKIGINTAVQIDPQWIKTQQSKSIKSGKPQKQNVGLAPQGIYKVYKLRHSGDTQEQEDSFKTEVMAVALGQPIPVDSTDSAVPVEGQGDSEF